MQNKIFVILVIIGTAYSFYDWITPKYAIPKYEVIERLKKDGNKYFVIAVPSISQDTPQKKRAYIAKAICYKEKFDVGQFYTSGNHYIAEATNKIKFGIHEPSKGYWGIFISHNLKKVRSGFYLPVDTDKFQVLDSY